MQHSWKQVLLRERLELVREAYEAVAQAKLALGDQHPDGMRELLTDEGLRANRDQLQLGGVIMVWFGADPGGKKNFGVAVVQEDGTYQTACVGFVDEAVDWIRGLHDAIDGAGIDAPLWWSSGQSGDRKVDQRLRKYGPVQAPNSLA
jgi:Protein of unknown function (DUF429)